MKAIILKIKGNYAAVLSQEGDFLKVRNKGYEIGQEIQVPKKFSFNTGVTKALVLAASLFLVLGLGYFSYFTPNYYVSVDVNPGLLLGVNYFERVVTIDGVNQDGKNLLVDLDVKHDEVSKAVKATLESIKNHGYLKTEQDHAIIGVIGKNIEKLEQSTQNIKQELTDSSLIKVQQALFEVVPYNNTKKEQAQEMGITLGKYQFLEKLQARTNNKITIATYANKSVHEIIQEEKRFEEERKGEEQDSKGKDVLEKQSGKEEVFSNQDGLDKDNSSKKPENDSTDSKEKNPSNRDQNSDQAGETTGTSKGNAKGQVNQDKSQQSNPGSGNQSSNNATTQGKDKPGTSKEDKGNSSTPEKETETNKKDDQNAKVPGTETEGANESGTTSQDENKSENSTQDTGGIGSQGQSNNKAPSGTGMEKENPNKIAGQVGNETKVQNQGESGALEKDKVQSGVSSKGKGKNG